MKRLDIKIVSPCNQKWESFEKRGLNGYCQSCEKEVVDFTKMSDREIKNYFLRTKGDVCGRVRKSQQKEYIYNSEIQWKPITILLFSLGSLCLTMTPSFAQKKDRFEQTDRKADRGKIQNEKHLITGQVTDDTGEALPGVNVVIKGTTQVTTTNLDGMYRIQASSIDVLVFSYVGFEIVEVEIGSRTDISVDLVGNVQLGEIVLGGVSSRWYTPGGLWWNIRGFFARVF